MFGNLRKKFWAMGIVTMMLMVMSAMVSAQDVGGWRYEGVNEYPDANVPLTWSGTENIVWKTELPTWGNATPVIAGDKLFITAEEFQLLCLDKNTGEILWSKDHPRSALLTDEEKAKMEADAKARRPLEEELSKLQKEYGEVRKAQRKDRQNSELREKANKLRQAIGDKNKEIAPYLQFKKPGTHNTNGYASSTPAVYDGKVYALFGNGVAACYDMDGNRQWVKHIENPTHGWGHSSSPMVVDGKLLIYILKLHALDPETGEEVWTVDAEGSRNTLEKWGTMFPVKIDDTWLVITGQGYFIRVPDGKVLAHQPYDQRWGMAYAKDGVAYAVDDKVGKALNLPTTVSDQLELTELWSHKGAGARVYASLLELDDILYTSSIKGFIAYDAKTGEEIYKENLKLGKTDYPSIVLAGDYLLVGNESGKTAVIKTGRTFELLGVNDLGDGYRTTPVIDGDKIYIRGFKNMYCIGN